MDKSSLSFKSRQNDFFENVDYFFFEKKKQSFFFSCRCADNLQQIFFLYFMIVVSILKFENAEVEVTRHRRELDE